MITTKDNCREYLPSCRDVSGDSLSPTKSRKAVSFSSETVFKEKEGSPPVVVTHTTITKVSIIFKRCNS